MTSNNNQNKMYNKEIILGSLEERFNAAGWGKHEEWSEAYKFYCECKYPTLQDNPDKFYYRIRDKLKGKHRSIDAIDLIKEIPLVGLRKVKFDNTWKPSIDWGSSYFNEQYLITGKKETIKRIDEKEARKKDYRGSFIGHSNIIYNESLSGIDEDDFWDDLFLNLGDVLDNVVNDNIPKYFTIAKEFCNLGDNSLYKSYSLVLLK